MDIASESVVVTKHARNRTKRMGLSKNLCDKKAEEAMEFGIRHSDATGNFKKYFDRLYLSHGNGNNIRIYHNYVYIFCDKVLITIMTLPSKYRNVADKIQRRKLENTTNAKQNNLQE